jgi:hypothetical protein
MSDAKATKPAGVRPAVATPSAPGWVLALYLGGLVLVYVGERVLSGLEKGAGVITAIGVLGVLGSTVLRFSPRFRAGGNRRSIEGQLAVLSAVGLVGLLCYLLTTPWGIDNLILGKLADATRVKALELLNVAWIVLVLLATLPMVFAETALRPMRRAERPESRRVRAAIGAGLTLGLAAVYGALFVYAASGVKLDVDFSYFKTSRPSESTKKLAQSLSDPVRVVAFFPRVSEVRTQVERYLNELKSGAPKLQIELQDRLLSPKLAKELRATQDGVIVLSRGTTTQNVVVGVDLAAAKAKLKTLDRDFQEQLTKLARARRTAYLTVGHGEVNESKSGGSDDPFARSGSIVRTLLQRQNYLVKDLGLAQGLGRDVPDDADVVLVLGPTEAFAQEELASLKRYLERHGKLYMALDADAFSTKDIVTVEGRSEALPKPAASAKPAGSAAPAPSAAPASSAEPPAAPASSGPLTELAALVGLTYGTDLLTNEKMHVRLRNDDSDRTRLITQSFSSHASVSTLSRSAGRAGVAFFGAGNLDKARGTTNKMDFAVRSPAGTFSDKNRNYALDRDAGEKQLTFNLAVAINGPEGKKDAKKDEAKDSKDPKKDDAKQKSNPDEMRAFVLADADALGDFIMAQAPYNQLLFIDSIRWLVGEESFAGPPNTEEDQRIQHTKQQDLNWFYATIFGAPSLVLALGLALGRRFRARGGQR